MKRSTIEWQAPEFEYREKGVSWYWLSIIAAILILGVSVWQKNFLFAIFVVIAEILVLVWAGRKPRILSFNFDDRGLTIDGKKSYLYSTVQAFCIKETADNEWLEFFLRFRHGLSPWLKVMVPLQESARVEELLSGYAEKVEPKDSFLDSLEKLIGF